MDLDGFVTYICSKVGETDPVSRSLCAGFIQRWYDTLYNRYPWRDSIKTVSATVTALSENIPLPAGLDRVISIRYGGDHFLDPIDDTFLVQADPTIFEQTGIPQYYREYTADDKTKQIQLYPTPSVDGALLIVGKKTAPPLLAGSDTPIIRNIDGVLITYGEGEMLQRMRQVGKAQALFQEASQLYTEAENLEKLQTNVPRGTKKLTVNGNSLVELTDAVCARIGDYLPQTRIVVKEYLRRQYQMIYDSALWPESLVPFRASSDGEQVILPDYIDCVVSVRAEAGGVQMFNEDVSTFFSISPQIFEEVTTHPVAYSVLTPVGVGALPPLEELLAFTSTDPMDNAVVMVRGESQGQIYEETVQLNGQAQVYTARAYGTPLTVAKPETHGDISVTGASSNLLLETIPFNQTERKHMRLWIQPTSSAAHSCLILGKRRINPFVQDEDTPMIRNIQNILINAATADALMKTAPPVSADYRNQANAALQILIDKETKQQSRSPRIIPYVEPGYMLDNDADTFFLRGVSQ